MVGELHDSIGSHLKCIKRHISRGVTASVWGHLLSDESRLIRQSIKDELVYYCSVALALNEEPSLVLGRHCLYVQLVKDSAVLCAYNCISDLDEVNHKKFSRVTLSYVYGILVN